MPPKKRKYNDDYVKLGFTCTTGRDGVEKPQCFLCAKTFCNDYMKPTRMKSHLQTDHPLHVNDSADQFRQKKARFHTAGKLTTGHGFVPTQKPALEASYRVAYRIAKVKKPHTIGETLIKPCALDMVQLMCGEQHRKALQTIPLSDNVIKRRIDDIADDILDQVIAEINASPFKISMQLDESTDCAQCSQLLVFVRYMHGCDIKEEFLFCEPLVTTTKAADVLDLVTTFMDKHNIPMDELGSLCTDGAPAMLGNKSGFCALVKRLAPHVTVTHCVLHRHALASKSLPENFKNIMANVVSAVNFIRSRALNHRLFRALCNEMGSEHEVLLYHTEVRWLSRGRVFTRVYELRKEIELFLRDKGNKLHENFSDNDFVTSLAYMSDVFTFLNELNTSLQGRQVTLIDAQEKIASLKQKLQLWKRRAARGNYASFPTLDSCLEEMDDRQLSDSVSSSISSHLESLGNSFDGYFQDPVEEESAVRNWIRNPFLCDLDSIDDQNMFKEDLIDIIPKQQLKRLLETTSVNEFWCSQQIREAYPALAREAISVLVTFVTSYLCEAGFSTMVTIKTKARNRLDIRGDMRVSLSKTEPRFKKLVSAMQQQSSH